MAFNFKSLIDLAIGSPEPGHVNFYALHCVLCAFAEKLDIIYDIVDCSKYDHMTIMHNRAVPTEIYLKKKLKEMNMKKKIYRLSGGVDPDELEVTEAEPNPAEEAPVAEAPPAAAPEAEDAPAAVPDTEAAVPEPEPEPAAEPAVEPEAVAATEPATAPADAPEPVAAQPEAPEAEPEPEPVPEPEPESEPVPEPEPLRLSAAQSLEAIKSIDKIEMRLQILEKTSLGAHASNGLFDLRKGASIMKDQIQTVMDAVHLLNDVVLGQKLDRVTTEQLRFLAKRLRIMRYDNEFIEGAYNFPDNFDAIGKDLYEEGEEEEEEEESVQSATHTVDPTTQPQQREDYELEPHLTYPTEKILDQMMELKTEFCLLTNKVNEITAHLLEQDCQRTLRTLAELQALVNDLKNFSTITKDRLERLEPRMMTVEDGFAKLAEELEELRVEKVDRSELTVLLADKVDYNQLQRKASQDQLLELQCRMEKQFCEVRKSICQHEKNLFSMLENIKQTLGTNAMEELMKKFKQSFDGDLQALRDQIDHYINTTNDDCVAAGGRIKVMQDFKCLSCDTNCVMRTRERAKVGKMPSAHPSSNIGALVTYELGSIRKSGIMGYYRKDEFPHAPNAWMNRQNKMANCVPRHAGGPHTVNTAADRVHKVTHQKKLFER